MSLSDNIELPGPLEDEAESEHDLSTLRWRFERLERAGYDGEAALALALDEGVDLRAAEGLLTAGCPVETALRILS